VRELPDDKPRSRDLPQVEVDPALAEYLRQWRRNMAREQKVPAYIVLHDSVLEELCRRRPRNLSELQTITGIGERKADIYGTEILQALRNFEQGERAVEVLPKESSPAEQTLRLLQEGRSFEEIARLRVRQLSTIASTVANLIETGRVKLDQKWISPDSQPLIEAACLEHGVERLSTIKEALSPYINYGDIRLVVAHLRAENRIKAKSA
jgi:ATP-dependent DNA helicase RecQ